MTKQCEPRTCAGPLTFLLERGEGGPGVDPAPKGPETPFHRRGPGSGGPPERELFASLRELTELAAGVLGVQRSSVWRYSQDRTRLLCLDLFIGAGRRHETGLALYHDDFPRYFAALGTARPVVASSAHTDPQTSEFSQIYLTPLRVGAVLNAPIRVAGSMIGTICNEHVGGRRVWSPAEIQLANALADFAALLLERRDGL